MISRWDYIKVLLLLLPDKIGFSAKILLITAHQRQGLIQSVCSVLRQVFVASECYLGKCVLCRTGQGYCEGLNKMAAIFARGFGYCCCLRVSVCLSVYVSMCPSITTCPRNNSWPVQASITKFWPEMQNNLIKGLHPLHIHVCLDCFTDPDSWGYFNI